MWTAIIVRREKSLNRRKCLWKIPAEEVHASLGAESLGTRPGNDKYPWKVQLVSLKYNWVPRSRRHPEIPLISVKTKNCNGSLSSEKVEIVWENKTGLKKQKISSSIICYRWKIEINSIYCLFKVVMSYVHFYLNDIKKTKFLPKMKLLSPRNFCAARIFSFPKEAEYDMNFLQDLGLLLGMPGWLQVLWCESSLKWDWSLLFYWSLSGTTSGVSSVCPATSGMVEFPSGISLSTPLRWFDPFWKVFLLILVSYTHISDLL